MLGQVVERDPRVAFQGGQPEEQGNPQKCEGHTGVRGLTRAGLPFAPRAKVEPARGDHLGKMHRVVGPEFRSDCLEPFARRIGPDQPHPPRQGQPERGQGRQGLEGITAGAAEDRVFVDSLLISLVERPLLGLAEGLGSDALPDRRQPDDRFQPVRLADLPHVAGDRYERLFRPADADRLGHRGVNSQQRRHSRLGNQPLINIRCRGFIMCGLDGEKPMLQQFDDGGSGSSPRVARLCQSPASGQSVASASAKRLSACLDPAVRPVVSLVTSAGESSWSVRSTARVLGRTDSVSSPRRVTIASSRAVWYRARAVRNANRGSTGTGLGAPGPAGEPGEVELERAVEAITAPLLADDPGGVAHPAEFVDRVLDLVGLDQKQRLGEPRQDQPGQRLPGQQLLGQHRLGRPDQRHVLVHLDGHPGRRATHHKGFRRPGVADGADQRASSTGRVGTRAMIRVVSSDSSTIS